jgi:hypothetical protein
MPERNYSDNSIQNANSQPLYIFLFIINDYPVLYSVIIEDVYLFATVDDDFMAQRLKNLR